ncbi:MAG: hypothetical protein AB1505_36010 [Candidatus Latescibacterota bacterium]
MSCPDADPGAVLAELVRLAEIVSGILDGEEVKRVITPQAMAHIANPDPEHVFLAGDYYDVDREVFLRTKKLLLRLERLARVPVDASVWVLVPGRDAVTVAVHNGVSHRYYAFGQESLPIPPEMREVLATGAVRQLGPQEDVRGSRRLVTVLTPVRDSLGDVVAVAELTSLLAGRPPAWN